MDFLLSYMPDGYYGRVTIGLIALVSYSAALAIYRLFFSALAGFPGPKIAAVTGYYESYYDIFLDGRYIFKIKEMHEKYGQSIRALSQIMNNDTDNDTGPIVRINPNEISISDPSYYDEVYVTGNKRRTEHYTEFLKGIDFDGEPSNNLLLGEDPIF